MAEQFYRLEGLTGTELRGADLTQALQQDIRDAIIAELAERGVVVIRDAGISPAQQVEFTRPFGDLETFPDQSELGNNDRHIFRVSNRGDGYNVGHYWHADRSPYPRPTAISTLLALDVAEQPATHTLFLNMAAAYDGLTKGMQKKIASLEWQLATRIPIPLVAPHPITGRAILALPFRFPGDGGSDEQLRSAIAKLSSDLRPRIAGWDLQESDALLFQLVRHLQTDPLWQYAHAWRPGDLVLWDQRTVYHQATMSQARRVLTRTAVAGPHRVPAGARVEDHTQS